MRGRGSVLLVARNSAAPAIGAAISGAISVTMAGLALAGALLSCVSDRATGTRADVAACTVDLPAAAFGSTVVVIRDFAFSPQQVRVRPGAKVTWVNCGAAGDVAHTSTADGGAWHSQLLPPGASFTATFDAAGSFPYHCDPHPFMTGTVTVE